MQDTRKEKDIEAGAGQEGVPSVGSLSLLGRAGTRRLLTRLCSSTGSWPALEREHQLGEVA